MKLVDLRSDTVTKPSPAMRAAMASAEVGDDVYGEDPTVRALEEHVAALLGKEAALFVPSGTMGNQLAIRLHTRPGDEVVIGEGAHCAYSESGAASALAGVQLSVAGRAGLFTAEEMEAIVKPVEIHHPRASLVCLENTHNRAGGRVFPQIEVLRIAAAARAKGLALHVDGARLWNAHVASGVSLSALVAPFDTASVCFSKGLGAPVGSALVGSRELVERGRRARKMLGGGMRQVGILAAAALHGLRENLPRLADDHRRARQLATLLASAPGAAIDLARVETNIVRVEVPGLDAALVATAARERGVLLGAVAPHALRAVFHLDVHDADVDFAVDALRSAIAEVAAR